MIVILSEQLDKLIVRRMEISGFQKRGVSWLMDEKNKLGWGDFPEESCNVERTADGLDTLLKFKRYCSGEPMSHFWAYSK